jgi:spore germination cell wall hydrolase CwlJ-like protein
MSEIARFELPNVLTALCLWREARGEPKEAKRGVLHVIRNRQADGRWPNSPVGVVLQPRQFSSFDTHDPNAVKWPQPSSVEWASFEECCELVEDPGTDPTAGATHYHSLPDNWPAPKWAKPEKLTVQIGALKFYKL